MRSQTSSLMEGQSSQDPPSFGHSFVRGKIRLLLVTDDFNVRILFFLFLCIVLTICPLQELLPYDKMEMAAGYDIHLSLADEIKLICYFKSYCEWHDLVKLTFD